MQDDFIHMVQAEAQTQTDGIVLVPKAAAAGPTPQTEDESIILEKEEPFMLEPKPPLSLTAILKQKVHATRTNDDSEKAEDDFVFAEMSDDDDDDEEEEDNLEMVSSRDDIQREMRNADV
jgi:hypothetical protein